MPQGRRTPTHTTASGTAGSRTGRTLHSQVSTPTITWFRGLRVTYDNAGDTTNDGTTAYTYDGESRIATASNSISGSSSYVYDANGKRVEKTTSSGGTVDFLYDAAGHEIAQVNSSGTWTRGEVYAAGRHVATLNSNTTYYNHSDWLGTERARSNSDRDAPYETCTSLPFGDWLTCTGGDPSPMHFTGKERDSESGLDNFGARYNSSQYGRFMSPDPLGGRLIDPQTLNKYSYVRNNPLNLTDPTGLDFYLGCGTKDHSGCTQVQIDPGNKDKTWVQAGKDGSATIVTSDSVRNGTNSATVDQNGVHVTTGGNTSQGIYFDNPASHTTDANGNDVNHNPITLQGDASKGFGGFSFNVNGNCGGTCLSSGSFTFNGTPAQAQGAMKAAGAWNYGFWDVLNSTPWGHHPDSDQFRFGSGPSSHLSLSWEVVPGSGFSPATLNPAFTTPATGDFHVDATVGASHAACANIPGVSCE